MAIRRYLQDTLGFTRNELKVLLMLAAATLAGAALRFTIGTEGTPARPPRIASGTAPDSAFAARARTLYDAPPPAAAARRLTRGTGDVPPSPHSIEINTADRGELMRLPGIGPVYADRILAYRSTHGPFRRVDDLLSIRGIGPKTLERLRPFVRVAAGAHP